MPQSSRVYAHGLPGFEVLMARVATARAHELARRVTDDPRTDPRTVLEIHTPGQTPTIYRRTRTVEVTPR